MIITDSAVKAELKRVRSYELSESIATYPDDDRDGRTDMQILADECSYVLSCFAENGHVLCDDLERAREILRITKHGKVMPLWKESLTPVYSKCDIQIAKDAVNEHRRLVNLMKRLNAKGYYGQW